MRRRKNRSWPHDLIALWIGLFLLFLFVGAFVAHDGQCAADEIAAYPSYSDFPGLETYSLAAPARKTLTAKLNNRYCTCGCLMTVASCLNNHTSCRTSKQIGLETLNSVRGKIQSAHVK